MVNYECVRCDYKTDQKCRIRLHIHKKIPCYPVKNDVNVLDYEDEILNKDESKKALFDKIKKLEDEVKTLKSELKNIKILYKNENTQIIENITEEVEEKKIKKVYKTKLNSVIRYATWNRTIGVNVGVYRCLCCNTAEISQQNFQCGHIISRRNGGEDVLDNLIPICGNCNSSMGSTNMDEFIKTLTIN